MGIIKGDLEKEFLTNKILNMKQTDYPTPELQAAYEDGRRIGRIEGMIAYQRHLIENLQRENKQLNQKLQEQKGGEL